MDRDEIINGLNTFLQNDADELFERITPAELIVAAIRELESTRSADHILVYEYTGSWGGGLRFVQEKVEDEDFTYRGTLREFSEQLEEEMPEGFYCHIE